MHGTRFSGERHELAAVLAMKEERIWIVGFGTVGQWLVRVLHAQAPSLADRYGFVPKVVGVANARDGFVYEARGLDPQTILGLASARRSLAELDGIRHWPSSAEGLAATEADVLVEVTASPADSGERGFTHMREALRRGIPVVTSNKWPVALHGVELAELAREKGVPFPGGVHCHVGNPGSEHARGRIGGDYADLASRHPQCHGQLHPHANGARRVIRGRSHRGTGPGAGRARPHRRRRRLRRHGKGDDPRGTRTDRRNDIHEGFLALACCLICWRRFEASFD